MKATVKKILVVFFALLSFSVNLYSNEGRIDFEGMEASRKAAMKKISKTHLIYMDLKVMFPDPKLRALAKAAGKGKISKINSLVSDGVNVNARGNRNATVLFWALKKANLEGYTRLLEMGADPNVVFDDGGSVMHWAPRMEASSEKDQFLIRALQHGGDPNLRA
ncbi:MAG: hypothetical protein KUG64_08735, partial [Cycloclasticus sp.]|nr:hypothetical protein [Cycloclasticus sp.]